MSPEIEPLALSRYWLQPQDGLARLAPEQGHRTKVPVIFSTEPLRKSLVGLPPTPPTHTNTKYLQCSLSSRVSRDGKSCLKQGS